MVVAFFESFLQAFIGGIICLIGTSSYIKTIAKSYGTEYQVKDHLRKTLTNNMLGLAIGFVAKPILTAPVSQSIAGESPLTFNWLGLIIFAIICAIAYPKLSIKINQVDE